MANWTDFDGNNLNLIDKPGVYLTKIVAVAEGYTKTGFTQLKLMFKTIDNNEFVHLFNIQSKTMWTISKFLKELGLSEQERQAIDFNKDRLELCVSDIVEYFNKYVIGRITEITLADRVYNDKTYLNLVKTSGYFVGNEDDFKDITGTFVTQTEITLGGGKDEDVPF